MIKLPHLNNRASQVLLVVKNLTTNAGVIRDTGLIPAEDPLRRTAPVALCLGETHG